MASYRRKPEVIETVKFHGDVSAESIVDLDLACGHSTDGGFDYLIVPTSGDESKFAEPGDYVVLDPQRFTAVDVIKHDEFERLYELNS